MVIESKSNAIVTDQPPCVQSGGVRTNGIHTREYSMGPIDDDYKIKQHAENEERVEAAFDRGITDKGRERMHKHDTEDYG